MFNVYTTKLKHRNRFHLSIVCSLCLVERDREKTKRIDARAANH